MKSTVHAKITRVAAATKIQIKYSRKISKACQSSSFFLRVASSRKLPLNFKIKSCLPAVFKKSPHQRCPKSLCVSYRPACIAPIFTEFRRKVPSILLSSCSSLSKITHLLCPEKPTLPTNRKVPQEIEKYRKRSEAESKIEKYRKISIEKYRKRSKAKPPEPTGTDRLPDLPEKPSQTTSKPPKNRTDRGSPATGITVKIHRIQTSQPQIQRRGRGR